MNTTEYPPRRMPRFRPLVPDEPQDETAKINLKLAVRLYNSGYHAGHHDTVEGGFAPIHSADMETHHEETVKELLAETAPQDDTAKLQLAYEGKCAELHIVTEERDKLRERINAWETELEAVMPTDFKDWHQNAKSEHPVVARMVIESLQKREAQAWEHLAE